MRPGGALLGKLYVWSGGDFAYVAIHFGDSLDDDYAVTVNINSGSSERLEHIAKALAEGGQVLGFVAFKKDQAGIHTEVYEHEEATEKYGEAIVTPYLKMMVADWLDELYEAIDRGETRRYDLQW